MLVAVATGRAPPARHGHQDRPAHARRAAANPGPRPQAPVLRVRASAQCTVIRVRVRVLDCHRRPLRRPAASLCWGIVHCRLTTSGAACSWRRSAAPELAGPGGSGERGRSLTEPCNRTLATASSARNASACSDPLRPGLAVWCSSAAPELVIPLCAGGLRQQEHQALQACPRSRQQHLRRLHARGCWQRLLAWDCLAQQHCPTAGNTCLSPTQSGQKRCALQPCPRCCQQHLRRLRMRVC